MTIKKDDYVIIEGYGRASAPLKIEDKKCKFNRQIFNLLDLEGLEYYVTYKIENEVFKLVDMLEPLDEDTGNTDYDKKYVDANNNTTKRLNVSAGDGKCRENEDDVHSGDAGEKEEITMEERTRRKYRNKKNEKKEKRIIVHELSPLSFHSSLLKRKKTFSLSAIAFLSFYVEKDRSVLIYDDKHALLSYTALYKGVKTVDVVGMKQSVKKVGNYIIKYTTLNDLSSVYDVVILADICDASENQQLCERIHSHLSDQLVIYRRNRDDAEKCFEYFLNHKSYVNVRMNDFFSRRYTIESMHPVVRGDYNEGYVITANKVVDVMECLSAGKKQPAFEEKKHLSVDEIMAGSMVDNNHDINEKDDGMHPRTRSDNSNNDTDGEMKNSEKNETFVCYHAAASQADDEGMEKMDDKDETHKRKRLSGG
ncbi:hypothetical protein THOM_0909 [Trachipleistophora hominis]|uniref:Uncharacterized protein n=1 Tax=Trachipleistophora hominis TaxID=72359 RepID=L7JXB7_TRAHO|nr:hypothetical protein THOM_0909 [Trachipleistophora hominis]